MHVFKNKQQKHTWIILVWNYAILCKNHIVLLFIFFIALVSAPTIKITTNLRLIWSIKEDRLRISRKKLGKSEVTHNTQVNECLWFQQKYSYYITAWQFIVIAEPAKAMKSKAVYLQCSWFSCTLCAGIMTVQP